MCLIMCSSSYHHHYITRIINACIELVTGQINNQMYEKSASIIAGLIILIKYILVLLQK